VVTYGQSQAEKLAAENEVCRQIVREVANLGISQRQALFVMYLMATELENGEHMKALTRLVRELGGDDLFLIGKPLVDVEMGGTHGTIDG